MIDIWRWLRGLPWFRCSPPRPPSLLSVTLKPLLVRGKSMSSIDVKIAIPTARVNASDGPLQPTDIKSSQILGSLAGAGVVTIGQITNGGTEGVFPILPGDWVISVTTTDVEGNVSAPSNTMEITVPAPPPPPPPPTLSAPQPPVLLSVTLVPDAAPAS